MARIALCVPCLAVCVVCCLSYTDCCTAHQHDRADVATRTPHMADEGGESSASAALEKTEIRLTVPTDAKQDTLAFTISAQPPVCAASVGLWDMM